MKTAAIMLVTVLGYLCAPLACADVFEVQSWTNKEGKVMEASIDHMPNKDSIILRAKNGGKRYPIKISSLSEDSQKQLQDLVNLTRDDLSGSKITAELIFKGVALNMRSETEDAAAKKHLALEVNGFRISTDKTVATLELESGLFAELKAGDNVEFFITDKSLAMRPKSVKARWATDYWWYRSERGDINRNSTIVVTKGESWKFNFTSDVRIQWGNVGVSDGPIISNR